MYFEPEKSLYSDTLVPDVLITEYMPSMDGNCVKVYLQCLYLSKYNRTSSVEELSGVLGLEQAKVREAILYLENSGIIARSGEGGTSRNGGMKLIDLKDKEIKRIYRMKTTSTPEEAIRNSERNKKRNGAITSINKTFFQGLMSSSWYTDIDAWFDRYKFDEEVMIYLFQHCRDHGVIIKNYIVKVAESWYNRNIRTQFDLEKFLEQYKIFMDISGKIAKKLRFNRNLTEYEEQFVEKWVLDFKYNFDIIELALRKTTSKTNPNFNYIDAIISDWNKNGYRTKDDILSNDTFSKQSISKAKDKLVPQQSNFEQRKYEKKDYDDLYEEV